MRVYNSANIYLVATKKVGSKFYYSFKDEFLANFNENFVLLNAF